VLKGQSVLRLILHFLKLRSCGVEPMGKLSCAMMFQHQLEYKLVLYSVVLLLQHYEIPQWLGLEAEAMVCCCRETLTSQ